jgi:hypothetical protein
VTDNADALKCAGTGCGYVHWLRNEPPPSPSPAAEDLSTLNKLSSKSKRARVRVLVFSLLANPELLKAWGTGASLVSVAKSIDDEIEKIE